MLAFFERLYPSANTVLLQGPRPILVDTGFGADADALEGWLRTQGTPPERLALVVNTHFHSDHCGGNHRLQSRYGVPVAAEAGEAAMVNGRDPDACRAWWLAQPVEPYAVQRPLAPGDVLSTGEADWCVLAAPGHTKGHIALFAPAHGLLVLGDALHDRDVGWLNPWREGQDSLATAMATVERIAAMPVRRAWSGHGPAIEDMPAALGRARERLRDWERRPERLAWHACKRVLAHALMLEDGLPEDRLTTTLESLPWLRDVAAEPFGLSPAEFGRRLVAEMLRAGAARWDGRCLRATAPYAPPPPSWPEALANPAFWPAIE